MILNLISLIINEIENVITCLWAICVFKVYPHGACISISFLLMNNIPLYGYTTLYLSIHWLMDI